MVFCFLNCSMGKSGGQLIFQKGSPLADSTRSGGLCLVAVRLRGAMSAVDTIVILASVGWGHLGSCVLYIGSLLLITCQTNLFIFAHVYVDFVVSEIGFWLLEARVSRATGGLICSRFLAGRQPGLSVHFGFFFFREKKPFFFSFPIFPTPCHLSIT